MNEQSGIKRGLVFLAVEKALNGTVAILIIPVLIQRIGVENYGLWGILLGLVAYVQCLDFGIVYSIERFVAFYTANKENEALEDFLSTAFTVLLLIAFAVAVPLMIWGGPIIAFLTKGSVPFDGFRLILSLYPVILISWITNVFAGVVRGLQRFDISSKIQISGKLLFAAVLVGLLTRNTTVYSAVYAFNIQYLLLLAGYLYFARKLLPDVHFIRLSLSGNMIKKMIDFGFKIQVSAFSLQINQQFDKFLLASFSNLAVVGYYDAASRIVYAIKDIPLFLFSVLIPQVSALSAGGNREEIRDLFFKVTSILAISGFLIIGVLVLNSEIIIGFVLKNETNDFSILVFNVLCITMVWQSMAAGAAYVARGMGMTQIEMKTAVIVLIVNIAASYVFIRFFDVGGVVFGTALSSVIAPVVCYVMVCREFSCGIAPFLHRLFTLPFVGFSAGAAVAYLVKNRVLAGEPWWVGVVVTSVVFLAVSNGLYLLVRYKPYFSLIEVVFSYGRSFIRRSTGK